MMAGMIMAITRPIMPAGCSKFLSVNRIESLIFIFEAVMRVFCLPAKYNFLCYRALTGLFDLVKLREKN